MYVVHVYGIADEEFENIPVKPKESAVNTDKKVRDVEVEVSDSDDDDIMTEVRALMSQYTCSISALKVK